MNSPFHIFHESDLYEVILRDRKIISIKRFYDKGTKYRAMSFPNLPEPVKDQILRKIRSLP